MTPRAREQLLAEVRQGARAGRPSGTPWQSDDVRRICGNERQLLGIVNSVIGFARLEVGKVHYDLRDVRVVDALAEADARIAPLAERKKLSYSTEHDCDGDEFTVHVDPHKLHQILMNLLANAVEFSRPGGHITLACESMSNRVAVRVTDEGIGIASEDQARIFQPFVQVGLGHARSPRGTGLGLAISRRLARDMGGDLFVESELGRGSTFTLTLRRGRGVHRAGAVPPAANPASRA